MGQGQCGFIPAFVHHSRQLVCTVLYRLYSICLVLFLVEWLPDHSGSPTTHSLRFVRWQTSCLWLLHWSTNSAVLQVLPNQTKNLETDNTCLTSSRIEAIPYISHFSYMFLFQMLGAYIFIYIVREAIIDPPDFTAEFLNAMDTRLYIRAKLCWLCSTFSDLYMQTGKFMFVTIYFYLLASFYPSELHFWCF